MGARTEVATGGRIKGGLLELAARPSSKDPSSGERIERVRPHGNRFSQQGSDQGSRKKAMLYFQNIRSSKVRRVKKTNPRLKNTQFFSYYSKVQNDESQCTKENPTKRILHDKGRHKGCLFTSSYCPSIAQVSGLYSQQQGFCLPGPALWVSSGPLCFFSHPQVSSAVSEEERGTGACLSRRLDCLAPRQEDMSRTYSADPGYTSESGIHNKSQKVVPSSCAASYMAGGSLVGYNSLHGPDRRIHRGTGFYGSFSNGSDLPHKEAAGKIDGKDSFCSPNLARGTDGGSRADPLASMFQQRELGTSTEGGTYSETPEVLVDSNELRQVLPLSSSSSFPNNMGRCLKDSLRSGVINGSVNTEPLDSCREGSSHKYQGTVGNSQGRGIELSETRFLSHSSNGQHNSYVCPEEPRVEHFPQITGSFQVSIYLWKCANYRFFE